MKQIKTKVVNLTVCWNNLRNIPPKEFLTIGEMEKVEEILNTLKEEISTFAEIIKEGEELNLKISMGEISPEDIVKVRKEWVAKSSKLEVKEKIRKVVVEFENEIFNTFFQLFERWGKNWFNRVGDFLTFRRDMMDANSRPQAKKK